MWPTCSDLRHLQQYTVVYEPDILVRLGGAWALLSQEIQYTYG